MTAEGSAPRSTQLFEAASRLIPGGVNSPARAWGRVGGNPRAIVKGVLAGPIRRIRDDDR